MTDRKALPPDLDLNTLDWTRAEPAAGTSPNPYEVAEWTDVDQGVTYTLVRNANEAASNSDAHVLVFTPSEWEAFTAGAKDGEFDQPGNDEATA
jgi:hypothetical protein